MTARPGGLTRRRALQLAGAGAAWAAAAPWAWAAGQSGLHGLSVFGDLKYPAGFKHFDYINPDAPKGGRMNFQAPYWYFNQSPQTFNTLNGFVLRGDAPPRVELLFDSLMVRATDEPDAVYGLLAETVDVSEDGNVFTFHLRDTPRFRDDTPVTAADVAFSLTILKDEGHPNLSLPMAPMASAEAPDERTVVVTLDGTQTRFTILSIVGLPVFSAAYYADRRFDASNMQPPLGSGPYTVGNVSAGRFIEYARVPDYWGADQPVNVGQNNFDVCRIDFYQERQAAFEAFKKGDTTYREEFTSKTWALEYNFPAITDGRVKKTLFPSEKRPSLQGWFFNMRRQKFADPRTRQGIALAFDFEWSNRNLFYDAYQRASSFFQKSIYMAEGLPGPDELALLEPYRDQLPEAVFGEAVVPPKTDGSGGDRTILRQASDLLGEAGWVREGNWLYDADGNQLTVEFLVRAAVFERVIAPFIGNLKRIGVAATIRQVDPAQFQSRMDDFDFDVVGTALSLSPTPLDAPRVLFSSEAAGKPGSYNWAGVSNPVVDALIDKMQDVGSQEELVTLARAIDRVVRAEHPWIPNWFSPDHKVAHWDIFGWHEPKPDYFFAPETTWWFDRDKAAAIGKAG